ncbi:MAG: hypothetical protein V7K97_31700 [Nostoc sp.]
MTQRLELLPCSLGVAQACVTKTNPKYKGSWGYGLLMIGMHR